MSKNSNAEIRALFAEVVYDSFVVDREFISEEKFDRLFDAGSAMANCLEIESDDEWQSMAKWFTVRLILDPMFSGMTQRDCDGNRDSAVLAVMSILKDRGTSVEPVNVLRALTEGLNLDFTRISSLVS